MSARMSAVKPTLAMLTLLLVFTTACGGGGPGGSPADEVAGTRQVRGQVVEVMARNIAEIERLTVRDQAGQEYTFTTEGFVDFTPSHLKEHQLFGQPVLVTYVEQKGRLVAVEIGD